MWHHTSFIFEMNVFFTLVALKSRNLMHVSWCIDLLKIVCTAVKFWHMGRWISQANIFTRPFISRRKGIGEDPVVAYFKSLSWHSTKRSEKEEEKFHRRNTHFLQQFKSIIRSSCDLCSKLLGVFCCHLETIGRRNFNVIYRDVFRWFISSSECT